MMRVIGKGGKKREKRVRDGSRGARIAIWGLRHRAMDPKEDNRQTVRYGAEQGTPDWILAWEFLNEGHLEGPRPEGPAGARRNWFTCHLLRRPLFSPDVAVPWRWNGEECKDAQQREPLSLSLSWEENNNNRLDFFVIYARFSSTTQIPQNMRIIRYPVLSGRI